MLRVGHSRRLLRTSMVLSFKKEFRPVGLDPSINLNQEVMEEQEAAKVVKNLGMPVSELDERPLQDHEQDSNYGRTHVTMRPGVYF